MNVLRICVLVGIAGCMNVVSASAQSVTVPVSMVKLRRHDSLQRQSRHQWMIVRQASRWAKWARRLPYAKAKC